MDLGVLEEIGLSQNEIKVYFALLELDQSSATPIVKKSKIPNSKVYPILDKLIQKGLVSFVIKNKIRYFQASDANNLIDLLDKKEKLIHEQKNTIRDLIPYIQKRRKSSPENQEARIYEGIKGVKVAFQEILNDLEEGDEYYVFTLGDELSKADLKSFFRNFHAKRSRKKIKVKLIANNNLRKIFEEDHKYNHMLIKYSSQNFPSGIFIFNNKVMTVIWGENPTAFVISSRSNYEQYRIFFQESWSKL